MILQAYFKYLPSVAFLAIFSLLFVLNVALELSNMQNFTSLISLILISTVGIYHGAFDIKKGIRISNYLEIKLSRFNIIYVLCTATIVFLWLVFPKFIISVFLLISIHHFGSEDYQYFNSKFSHLASLVRGLLIVILPLIFHYNETTLILETLKLSTQKNLFLSLDSNFYILFILSIINFLFSYFLILDFWNRILINVDMILIILLNYIFDPLFAFSIYFCFLHSIRSVSKIKRFKLKFDIIILTSFITFILLIMVFSLLYIQYDLLQSLNYTIFIGLAALTFPHIATDFIFNKLNLRTK